VPPLKLSTGRRRDGRCSCLHPRGGDAAPAAAALAVRRTLIVLAAMTQLPASPPKRPINDRPGHVRLSGFILALATKAVTPMPGSHLSSTPEAPLEPALDA
jgi:hypothetical protein